MKGCEAQKVRPRWCSAAGPSMLILTCAVANKGETAGNRKETFNDTRGANGEDDDSD